MATFEELQRLISLEDTKANLVSLVGTFKEISITYATDTKQIGIYNGTGWTWVGNEYHEVIMETGVTPPTPILNSTGDDWVYSN